MLNADHKFCSLCRGFTLIAGIIVLSSGTMLVQTAKARDEQPKITWDKEYRAVRFAWLGYTGQYPDDLAKGEFPPPGEEPQIKITKEWPIVAIRARWTTSTKNWPAKYRSQALDLVLMYASNAELYHTVFPKTIKASHFAYPPEYIKEAQDPHANNLVDILRGKEVAYQITAKAGTGLPDYTIKTKIRLGVSKDEKTVFYSDLPEYISRYLTQRLVFFAVRDVGQSLYFEVRALALCKPRRLFKGATLDVVEKDTRYMLERFHAKLGYAPTKEKIEAFLKSIKIEKLPIKVLDENYDALEEIEMQKPGFLSDYSKLRTESKTSMRYIDARALGRYSTFIVDPVVGRLYGDARGKISEEDLRDLTNYMHAAIVKELSKNYTIAYRPGPRVARIRVAITDLKKSTKLTGASPGGASMEAEMVDSQTHQQIGAVVESQLGEKLSMASISSWGDAKQVMDDWAKRLRKRLDDAH